MRKAAKWVAVLIGFYLLSASMIYFIQEKLIFLPTKLPLDYQYEFDHSFEEIFLEANDGARLNALHFKSSDPKGVILYFHGNAGNLARWGEIATSFVDMDYDVVIMDYRTYGKSKGTLSEQALIDDGQLFYDYVLSQYQEEQLILYGRSLGTGIATKLAAENNPAKVLLETPYYSLLDIAESRFPYLPVKRLLKYQFKSFENVRDINCRISVFHGTSDEVIPLDSGRRLYESIPGSNKELFVVPGGQHNNLAAFKEYRVGISEVLAPSLIK